jgi:hypothetical protein
MSNLINMLKTSLPKYVTEQPSTGKKVKFRPFTVREEKTLLISNQTGTYEDFLFTLSDVINNCFELNIDSKKLPIFDIEYFFLILRSKSIGEIIEPTIICPITQEKINLTLNLDDIKPIYDNNHNKEFVINNEIKITMKYPSLEYMALEKPEDYYEILIDCIDKIETKEEIIEYKNTSRELLKEFVDNLTQIQFQKMIDFLKTMPKIEKEIKYKTSDGIERTLVLKGLQDFFQSASAT